MAKKVKIKKRNVGIAVGFLVVLIVAIIGIFKWKAKLEYQKHLAKFKELVSVEKVA